MSVKRYPDYCGIYLWSTDPEINRDHILAMTNQDTNHDVAKLKRGKGFYAPGYYD